MKLSDLQPLDKIFVCSHALEAPEQLNYVNQIWAGDLDFRRDRRQEDITVQQLLNWLGDDVPCSGSA